MWPLMTFVVVAVVMLLPPYGQQQGQAGTRGGLLTVGTQDCREWAGGCLRERLGEREQTT